MGGARRSASIASVSDVDDGAVEPRTERAEQVQRERVPEGADHPKRGSTSWPADSTPATASRHRRGWRRGPIW